MHLDPLLLPRQANCVACPDTPPACNCNVATQDCFLINRVCEACSTFKCVDKPKNTTQASGGTSKGALAGAVIGSLIFVAAVVGAFFWYRRRNASLRSAEEPKVVDKPASAADVLSRPDPIEKSSPSPSAAEFGVRRNPSANAVDPNSQNDPAHSQFLPPHITHNPFEDTNSIQTTGTEGTNAIPIAFIAPDSNSRMSDGSTSPVRPLRSPDLNLNLDHVNMSRDELKPGAYARSQISGISGISGVSSRNSYMSNASYSSDFLNEAPMIITPAKAAVRQVVGVVKAEVINAPGSHNNFTDGLRPINSRPALSSPLAATSFGPSEAIKEADESMESNPFSDKHSAPPSAAASVTAFDDHKSENGSLWVPDEPTFPWSTKSGDSRPTSISTQAASVIDIGSATRVNVGLGGLKGQYAIASPPISANGVPKSPYRQTMGRLVTPPSNASMGTLEEQQQRALLHAQARAQAQDIDKAKRISGSSALSATSTRADSILESFPFVPPSPISDRPLRSPPVSPRSQQFSTQPPSSPLAQQSFSGTQAKDHPLASESNLPPPPDRRTLGLSTGSQLSTASSGLGSFPFQIDAGTVPQINNRSNSQAPSSNARQRASLDTLALTSDLSSYPLEFESPRPPLPSQR
ncbi:hypothetical protein CCMSSC00406_0001746 [Pleurotus cornucopiae]|uniref:Uncharacterized protein n=1 Tax=Pleurotus cornucopiae TaxID=5321 RepID=A0ACB7IQK1_PLECO|nr:hypothetical protein CCMSSC00406_0001746 [Pleurotus cornucopiae]